MKPAFETLRALDRAPTGDEVVTDLMAFHAERPGVTEGSIGAMRDAAGRTSYEHLAGVLPPETASVLELGCGNGPLLDALLRREPRLARVVGVDGCAPEVERARERLRDPRLSVVVGDLRAVPLDERFDVIVSHHALYLVRPIEKAIAEVARLLKPGGTLAMVTWSPEADQHHPFAEMMTSFGALTHRDVPHFQGWGDRRMFSREGLSGLLSAYGFGDRPSLDISAHTLSVREPVDDAVQRLRRFFYSVDLQRPETQRELLATWRAQLEAVAHSDGTVDHTFPYGLVVVTRPRG